MNRGADGQDIFIDDSDRRSMLGRLGVCIETHSVRVHAYALLSNHFHLLIDFLDGDISAFMRDLQVGHARWINHRSLDRTGPLFQRRYVSVPVTDDRQFTTAVRYVHRNPLPICGSRHLDRYPFSSLGAHLGRTTGPSWLCRDEIASRLDLSRHLAHVLEPLPSDRMPYVCLPPLRPTTLDEVVDAVDAGLSTSSDRVPERLRLALIVTIARRCRAASDVELGARFSRRPVAVRSIAHRFRVRCGDDPALRSALDEALRRLG